VTGDLNEAVEKAIETTENGTEPAGFTVSTGYIPFFLFIVRPNADQVEIDLEEHGWMKTYAEWMRGRSRWYLMSKPTPEVPARAWLAVDVQEGDQPYYTARHIVRVKGRNAGAQLTAYGIGAKRTGGTTDRMWILPGGIVCAGDDVETIGDAIIDAAGN
jgi:hypothetical protein